MDGSDIFTAESFWKDFDFILKQNNCNNVDFFPNKNQVAIYNQIDSTNSELLRQLNNFIASDNAQSYILRETNGNLTDFGKTMHLKLIASCLQTNGRGRIGRTFYSPANKGIYFSFVYAPLKGVKNPAFYTVTAAVCICRAIEKLYGVSLQIKWVNDIYLNGKKICGILTEGFFNPHKNIIEAVVVGIGINIELDKNIPLDVAKKAGGILSDLQQSCVTRSKLLAQCMFELYSTLQSIQQNSKDIIEEYKERSFLIGKTVTVSPIVGDTTLEYKAKVLAITDNASLLVCLQDGTTKQISSGEVTLHNM